MDLASPDALLQSAILLTYVNLMGYWLVETAETVPPARISVSTPTRSRENRKICMFGFAIFNKFKPRHHN